MKPKRVGPSTKPRDNTDACATLWQEAVDIGSAWTPDLVMAVPDELPQKFLQHVLAHVRTD